MKHTNETILKLFESALAQFQTPEEPELLYSPIIYSMSGGGTRLRPVLLLLPVDAFGGDVEAALPAGMSVWLSTSTRSITMEAICAYGLPSRRMLDVLRSYAS